MKVFRNPEILWREEEDSKMEAFDILSKGEDASDVGTSVLFSDGVMLSLNVLGTEIWKLCDGKSVDEIVAALLPRFEVESDVLKKDTLHFLSELDKKGFIRYEE